MGCCSKNNIYLNISIARAILFLAISILILQFGMFTPVRGAGGVGMARVDRSVQRVITLTNQCTGRNMQVVGRKINAVAPVRRQRKNPQAQLLLTSVDHGTLTIQSNQSKEYICFSSKGRLTTRPSRRKGDCVFREIHNNNMYSYQSVKHPNYMIGFRHKHGKKLRGNAWRRKPKLQNCYLFTKPSVVRLRPPGDGNSKWAPPVNLDGYKVKNNNRWSHRRRYRGQSPNENRKWAPKIDLHSHRIERNVHEKT